MSRPRVVILIDQVTRDGVGQLLVAHYLRNHGVAVTLTNQGTFIPTCERVTPHVVFTSWMLNGSIMEYLRRIRRKTQVVLIDQEGARLGEAPYKRMFRVLGGVKRQWGRIAAKICVWGPWQAQWTFEEGVAQARQIVTTGCPKLDPYLVPTPQPAPATRHIGFTCRYDQLTAAPEQLMEHVFEFAHQGLFGAGYPEWAQQEDRIWHAVASARHMFKTLDAVAKQLDRRIVLRPGPWERYGVYGFVTRSIPRVIVDPWSLQHEYIRNACVVFDECSTLGIEALVAGIPVISIQRLIPRIDDHIGGEGAGFYLAPFLRYYWKPTSIDEAVDLAEQASSGRLPPVPDALGVEAYLQGTFDWPVSRPAAFRIGDVILELLERPIALHDAQESGPTASEESEILDVPYQRFRRAVFRAVPGATVIPHAKFWWRCITSQERQHLRRYHYFHSTYLHHRAVAALFSALLMRDGAQPAGHGHPVEVAT